ncbi:MAG: hypothetical protein JKY48_03525 [Flavobacteriales bacterium]|nr:hypothetical protein [Flavobacteriales bacterium]
MSQNIENIENQLINIERAPKEIAKLESELKQLQGSTKMLYSSVLDMRESLLYEISELSSKYNVSLKSFPEYYIQDKENFELTTSPIVLQGTFKNLVMLMDEFEKMNTSGKVSSAYFNIEESPRTKKRSLSLTLYIQSINV